MIYIHKLILCKINASGLVVTSSNQENLLEKLHNEFKSFKPKFTLFSAVIFLSIIGCIFAAIKAIAILGVICSILCLVSGIYIYNITQKMKNVTESNVSQAVYQVDIKCFDESRISVDSENLLKILKFYIDLADVLGIEFIDEAHSQYTTFQMKQIINQMNYIEKSRISITQDINRKISEKLEIFLDKINEIIVMTDIKNDATMSDKITYIIDLFDDFQQYSKIFQTNDYEEIINNIVNYSNKYEQNIKEYQNIIETFKTMDNFLKFIEKIIIEIGKFTKIQKFNTYKDFLIFIDKFTDTNIENMKQITLLSNIFNLPTGEIIENIEKVIPRINSISNNKSWIFFYNQKKENLNLVKKYEKILLKKVGNLENYYHKLLLLLQINDNHGIKTPVKHAIDLLIKDSGIEYKKNFQKLFGNIDQNKLMEIKIILKDGNLDLTQKQNQENLEILGLQLIDIINLFKVIGGTTAEQFEQMIKNIKNIDAILSKINKIFPGKILISVFEILKKHKANNLTSLSLESNTLLKNIATESSKLGKLDSLLNLKKTQNTYNVLKCGSENYLELQKKIEILSNIKIQELIDIINKFNLIFKNNKNLETNIKEFLTEFNNLKNIIDKINSKIAINPNLLHGIKILLNFTTIENIENNIKKIKEEMTMYEQLDAILRQTSMKNINELSDFIRSLNGILKQIQYKPSETSVLNYLKDLVDLNIVDQIISHICNILNTSEPGRSNYIDFLNNHNEDLKNFIQKINENMKKYKIEHKNIEEVLQYIETLTKLQNEYNNIAKNIDLIIKNLSIIITNVKLKEKTSFDNFLENQKKTKDENNIILMNIASILPYLPKQSALTNTSEILKLIVFNIKFFDEDLNAFRELQKECPNLEEIKQNYDMIFDLFSDGFPPNQPFIILSTLLWASANGLNKENVEQKMKLTKKSIDNLYNYFVDLKISTKIMNFKDMLDMYHELKKIKDGIINHVKVINIKFETFRASLHQIFSEYENQDINNMINNVLNGKPDDLSAIKFLLPIEFKKQMKTIQNLLKNFNINNQLLQILDELYLKKYRQ